METTYNLVPHFNDQLSEIQNFSDSMLHDHFESFAEESELDDYADVWDTIAQQNIPVLGIKGDQLRQAGGFFGKIFGLGNKEDKSTVGFQNFIASGGRNLPFYPTKTEMLSAAANGFPDRGEPAAIQSNYDQNTGTWQRGDWHFQVVSTSPIIAKAFKGAKESGTITSTVNAAVPYNMNPVNAIPYASSTSASVPTVSGGPVVAPKSSWGFSANPTSAPGASNTNANITPSQTAQLTPAVSPVGGSPVSSQTGAPVSSDAGGASLVTQVEKLFPSGGTATGGQIALYIGVAIVVIGLILFLAFKK